jgi:hypothetical protein
MAIFSEMEIPETRWRVYSTGCGRQLQTEGKIIIARFEANRS